MFEELYSQRSGSSNSWTRWPGSRLEIQAFAENSTSLHDKTRTGRWRSDRALSMLVAKPMPNMTCTSTDLPPATEIASRKIAEAGLSDRVKAQPIDFFKDPIPPADGRDDGNDSACWNLEKKSDAYPQGIRCMPKAVHSSLSRPSSTTPDARMHSD